MGVLDKLKNALFEVEYVEVEEPPKKEKKTKVREKKEKEKNKPIAKKIVLPGKKEEKIEELEEEELKDEDFEIRPKDETMKDKVHDEFKFMDDKDFQVEEEYVPGDPEILQVIEDNNDIKNKEPERDIPSSEVALEEKASYSQNAAYHERTIGHDNKLYGRDTSYDVPIHQYGAYEKKEDKSYFKPSPIISPIYGILDKNYTKEDVKEKKEVRLTTYSRGNVSVDDIRNKAYGALADPEVEEDTKFEVEEEEDNVLVDLSDRAKPEVKELTMGDALEYFQDLGLEYNVDYVDVSKEKNESRRKNESADEQKQDSHPKHAAEEQKVENIKPVSPTKVVEVQEERNTSSDTAENDNDNLFDLIDSMYQE